MIRMFSYNQKIATIISSDKMGEKGGAIGWKVKYINLRHSINTDEYI